MIMTLAVGVLFALAVFGSYWYLRSDEIEKPKNGVRDTFNSTSEAVSESRSPADPFIERITSERARIDAAVLTAESQYKEQLAERYCEDVQLKERLSSFARDNKLDEALVALWQEIRHYPDGFEARVDFATSNYWKLSGVRYEKGKDKQSIEFVNGVRHFKITLRTWTGEDYDSYADFSLFEEEVEVFSIGCEIVYRDHGESFRCLSVSAMKKQGDWASMLLHHHGLIRIDQSKRLSEGRYWGAEKIKSRFKE